jgi:signal transduction histidine kinase
MSRVLSIMGYEFTVLAIPFVFAIGCLLVLGYFLYQLRDERIARALLVWMLPFLIWSIAVISRLSATTVDVEILWHRIRFLGPSVSAVGYILIAAAYTSRDNWYQPTYLVGVSVIPVITNLLVWTNPLHQLVGEYSKSTGGGPFVATFEPGPWFVVHGVYSYLLIAVGTYWLIRKFFRLHKRGLYRVQVTTILVAMIATMASNFLHNIGLTTIDWTPVGGAVSATVIVVAMFQYRLLDVSPVARDIAVENMDSGMIVIDEDERLADVNDRAETLLETDLNTAVGEQMSEIAATREQLLQRIRTADTNTTVSVEHDDETYHYDVTVSRITDATDEAIGRVVVFSDMSQEIRQRRRLETQTQELQRKNQRLEQFASVVSHDLRNPLSIAQNYLDFARETNDEEDFVAVEEAHERMDTLLDEILTMARVETTVEEPESVQLAAIADEAWQTLETDDAVFENDVPPEAAVDGDPSLIRILFQNLFRNAINHNDGSVTIRAGVVDSDDGFFVEDDGVGIPENMRKAVFQYGKTSRGESIGIGLAIVKELVIAHGWEISATEAQDGGARFEITTVSS